MTKSGESDESLLNRNQGLDTTQAATTLLDSARNIDDSTRDTGDTSFLPGTVSVTTGDSPMFTGDTTSLRSSAFRKRDSIVFETKRYC